MLVVMRKGKTRNRSGTAVYMHFESLTVDWAALRSARL